MNRDFQQQADMVRDSISAIDVHIEKAETTIKNQQDRLKELKSQKRSLQTSLFTLRVLGAK
jgi:hypothetical protein